MFFTTIMLSPTYEYLFRNSAHIQFHSMLYVSNFSHSAKFLLFYFVELPLMMIAKQCKRNFFQSHFYYYYCHTYRKIYLIDDFNAVILS